MSLDEPLPDHRTVEPRQGLALKTLQATLDRVTRECEEKSLLLSELRHRMKNNFQTVQSLLRLQKARTPNFSTKNELANLEMQIAALNGVDGELLVAEANQSLDLGAYLRRLLGKLKDAFGANPSLVRFRMDIDAIDVPCRTAANIGLLVNEAITNSLKHAVPDGASEIYVSLKRADIIAILSISDNGPGFQVPELRHVGGIGLMKRLAERARATLERDLGRPGTCYTIRIPLSSRGATAGDDVAGSPQTPADERCRD